MRVIFMGTPGFALPSLEALLARGEELVAVVTQPDRPRGRGQTVAPPPVKVTAIRAGVPVQQPQKVRQPEFLDWCRTAAPDLIVVVAFGQILPKALLDIPRHGCINVHASLLPKYRGAAPIAWAIIRGESETGITTIQMDPGMDTGDVLLREAIAIGAAETAGELGARLAELGARVLLRTLESLDAVRAVPQDSSLATLAPRLAATHGATVQSLVLDLASADVVERVAQRLAPRVGAGRRQAEFVHVDAVAEAVDALAVCARLRAADGERHAAGARPISSNMRT